MKPPLTRGRRTRRLRLWLAAHRLTRAEALLYRVSVRRGWTVNR